MTQKLQKFLGACKKAWKEDTKNRAIIITAVILIALILFCPVDIWVTQWLTF